MVCFIGVSQKQTVHIFLKARNDKHKLLYINHLLLFKIGCGVFFFPLVCYGIFFRFYFFCNGDQKFSLTTVEP